MHIEWDDEIKIWIAFTGSEFNQPDGENPHHTCYGTTYDELILQVEAYFLMND